MPISRKEIPANITTGDLSVNIAPATAGVQQPDTVQLGEGSTVIPGGAYEVMVYNTGLEPITVNGNRLESNDKAPFEKKYNRVTNREDFTPAITVVVPADGSAYYTEIRPSV